MSNNYYVESFSDEQILKWSVLFDEHNRKALLDIEPFSDAETLGYIRLDSELFINIMNEHSKGEKELLCDSLLVDDNGVEWGRMFVTCDYGYYLYTHRHSYCTFSKELLRQIAKEYPKSRLVKRF